MYSVEFGDFSEEDRLAKKYGLTAITPNEAEQDYINSVIFDELFAGKINDRSKEGFIQIIDRLPRNKLFI